MCADLGETMSRNQPAIFSNQSCLLTTLSKPSKRLQMTAFFLTVCSAWPISRPSYGQTPSDGAAKGHSEKICDGTVPPPKSTLQTANADEPRNGASGASSIESGYESSGLKLSTKAEIQEASGPQGLFCNRTSSDSHAQGPMPAVTHSQGQAPANQSLATLPIVEVTSGKLIIRANGQDLFSVLDAVRTATGITIDMPASRTPDPVFVNVGPLSTQDALVALLEGAQYNYVIVGSEKDPQLVTRLVLSEQSSKPAGSLVASTHNEPATPQPELYGGQGVEGADGEAQIPQPPPGPPPIQPAAPPASVPSGVNIQQMAAQSGKTTGQILDELQKRQLQQLDDQAVTPPPPQ